MAEMIGVQESWWMQKRMDGKPNGARMLTGALLLCLALMACSPQGPASSVPDKEAANEPSVSGKASLAPGPATDVSSGSPSQSSSPQGGGQPPAIEKVSLEPGSPVTGDQVRAIVQAKGPGGDPIKVQYRWKIDGRVVQESEESILNSSLHRGDFVELEVIPGNSVSTGKPVTVSTFVGDAPPQVRFSGQSLESDNMYQANIEATDPEGGPVRFVLKSGPPGMTVDPATGAVRWAVRPEHTGASHEVLIAAQDGEGAETLLSYQIKTHMEATQGIGNNANNAASSK